MALNIVSLIKQVPDTANISGQVMKEDGTVNRAALPAVTNPEDLNGLELAIELKERYGATVTAISMGPPRAADVLREALFRGADRAILLTDRRFAGADTLATSYALACAVKRLGAADLVIGGRQAIDGDTAQVGPQTAEKLGIPQITCVEAVTAIEDGILTARRAVEGGFEIRRGRLPLLLTVVSSANDPRPPSAKLLMAYKNARTPLDRPEEDAYLAAAMEGGRPGPVIEQWGIEEIGAAAGRCGLSGSPTKVNRIESVVLASTTTRSVANTDGEIAGLIAELAADHIIG